ncbi:DUF4843 domain-containing protein [Pedobacter psychroterrae]|uniref:DUF4843 domain-containing protein n=1 Tax=Pedobacter psychroterrae TaxID=2530453 RepID=A0A4R0NQZ9_9SPHI|nr:DUF4843 domain-containing protein [Pedobacter psychroterrae]TCD03511.1 DUF4843 domain-containing protein [Pedobacter psychroterrae]
MKKYIYIIVALLAFCAAFVSCKKNLNTYDGVDGIYFLPAMVSINQLPVNDSSIVSFGYAKPELKDSVFYLQVRAAGLPSKTDRDFKLTIDPSSTAIEGTHYEFVSKNFVIPANETVGRIFLKLNRIAELTSKPVILRLNLEENANFKTPMEDRIVNVTTGKKLSYIQHSVWFDDILKKPKSWLDFYMGTFSRKKLFLLAEVAEIEKISDLDNTALTPIPKSLYYATFMQRYLNEMKAAGKTIYEEDSSEMIMGPGVQ